MTPDRNDHTHDEPENGVLSETGSLDTTGFGILGGGTAQVNVELPTDADDDLDDDGVIDGEVPFIIEIPADADLPVDQPVSAEEFGTHTTEAEIVDDAADLEEWTVEGDGFPPARPAEDIADADVVEYEASVIGAEGVDDAEPAVHAEADHDRHGHGHDEGGVEAPFDGAHQVAEQQPAYDGEHHVAEQQPAYDAADSGVGESYEAFAEPEDLVAEPAGAELAEPAEPHTEDGQQDESAFASEAEFVAQPEIAPEPDLGAEPERDAEQVFSAEEDSAAEPELLAEIVDEPEPIAHDADAAPAAQGAAAADDEFPIDFEDVEFEDADFEGEFDPAEFDLVLDDDGAEAALADAALAHTAASGDDVIATDDTAEDPMTAKTPADDASDAAPAAAPAQPAPPAAPSLPAAAAAAAATPVTGPVPSRRRSGQSTGAQPVVERSAERAVERSLPRADVALTSKRLGEFESGRETADLLTADRLLDPHQVVRPEPEGAWQQFVYSISGRRINLGDSKRARARKELDRRIAAPLPGGARFVPVLSRKGGVGKTTVTTLLGMALADARDDRVIAVDANPDRGTLAERITRESGKTVRDLVRIRGEVVGFNDLSNMVARDETRLDVVASDADPRVSEAFNDADYRDVASLAAHYYSVVLTDTGTGIVHSVMEATLDLADQLVIVAGLSVDEARLASETLTWLETNGHSEKVRNAVVVLNSARPGHPLVQLDELETHFRTRVRAVVRVPYDPHIAAGSAIVFRELHPATRQAARELAATVVEGLRSLPTAA